MNIKKLWAYLVAYLALAVGAGISIAGNVADTFRIGGPDTGALDIWIAAFWPAAVLLAIEMFVSPLWRPSVASQSIRWTASLGVGGLAMRVSWIHLSELLASRHQTSDVATFGPLAIDGLAIMATALILSGRRAVATLPGAAAPPAAADVLAALAAMAQRPDWTMADQDDLDDAAGSFTPADETFLAEVEAGTAPVVRRTVPVAAGGRGRLNDSQRHELTAYLAAGAESGALRTGEIDTMLAAYFEISPRTVRRARADAGIAPVSAPPARG